MKQTTYEVLQLVSHLRSPLFLPPKMASRLTRTGYTARSTLYNTWKQQQSISGPMIRNQKVQQQCKEYGRPNQPYYRKTKEAELASGLVSKELYSTGTGRWTSKIGVVSWYLGMVKTRPIITKSITSAFIYAAADLTSQTMAKSSGESYDLVRTSRMAGYGMILLGPTLHYWFNFVSKILPKRDLVSTLKKLALAQTVYGPCMTVVFFSVNAALQGEKGEAIIARLKRDVVPTMINGVMYWPLCDFITFKFVPVHLQPLVSNSFSYIWNVYMTYMASLETAG